MWLYNLSALCLIYMLLKKLSRMFWFFFRLNSPFSDILKEKANCVICIDNPTDPIQLQKCGHIVCKKCIKQYFEYKPTCPICGIMYGKVTGDQPPGTMAIRTNGIRLQGFNDSSGTIVLTYIFNDGKQGVSFCSHNGQKQKSFFMFACWNLYGPFR